MSYLSEHYYKLMKTVPDGNGKRLALKTAYHKEKIKSWWLDEENFVENWARPQIQRVLDEEVKKMIDTTFNEISVNLKVWK